MLPFKVFGLLTTTEITLMKVCGGYNDNMPRPQTGVSDIDTGSSLGKGVCAGEDT